jgi:hypothetical protein
MDEQIEKTFAMPEGCDLVVENVRGEITVEGWDQPSTQVVAIRRKGKADIEITQDGRKVIARTKHERNGLFWLDWLTKGGAPVVDYTVHVPYASDLKLKNVNGTVSAAQVQGTVRIKNVDGTAVLNAIKGRVEAETVNGSLQVTALEGTANLKTVNGQMKVSGNLSGLGADTVNGDIKAVATLAVEGDYVFHTVNGSCRLCVQPELRAHVSAHGVNMSVDCKVPSQAVERKFGSWEGTIGAGDGPLAQIRFSTVNGRLRIDQAEGAAETPSVPFVAKAEAQPRPADAPPAPEPPEPETTPVEVKVAELSPADPPVGRSQAEVLQMVERGEISVDEAIKLLGQKD